MASREKRWAWVYNERGNQEEIRKFFKCQFLSNIMMLSNPFPKYQFGCSNKKSDLPLAPNRMECGLNTGREDNLVEASIFVQNSRLSGNTLIYRVREFFMPASTSSSWLNGHDYVQTVYISSLSPSLPWVVRENSWKLSQFSHVCNNVPSLFTFRTGIFSYIIFIRKNDHPLQLNPPHLSSQQILYKIFQSGPSRFRILLLLQIPETSRFLQQRNLKLCLHFPLSPSFNELASNALAENVLTVRLL